MSKHVTFIIGNGFDLNIGLKTRYIDFYKVYTNENKNDSNVLQKFKKEILRSEAHGWKNWMDFEIGMGKQSKHFDSETPVEDFMECFDNFAVCFNKYLVDECEKIDWDSVDTDSYKNFISSMRKFYLHIKTVPSNTIQNLLQHSWNQAAKLNVIQFNYTDVFDMLIKKSGLLRELHGEIQGNSELNRLGANLHVHGSIGGGYPSIGVNDESQIENEIIKNDTRIHKIFVKPQFLDALQKRDANRNIPRADALNAIKESAIICAFGVSMGDSDAYWWEKIGVWLKESTGVLVIFDVCGNTDDGVSPLAFLNSEMSAEDRRKEIVDRFIRLSNIEKNWIDACPNRIIVELDTDMFSFKLPVKSDSSES